MEEKGNVVRVRKSGPLKGTVHIEGAKNTALPVLAASLLANDAVVIEGVPPLTDIVMMLEVIESLGAKVEYLDEKTIKIDARNIDRYEADSSLMNKMRASFLVMGPLLAKKGKAIAGMPGGCHIGKRPVDLHLKGFEALGATITDEDFAIRATVDGRLKGGAVYLDFPSVGATQNIMMAATLADGETCIENAAKEPEIVDLANFLNKMGARVRGAGTSTIWIEGVDALSGTIHQIIPDRIEAATFMCAAAITGGDVVIENVIASHIRPVIAKLRETGCQILEDEDGDRIRVIGPKRLKATNIRTLPYPGFPTDVQAQFMALMTVADGTSKIEETVFENRFMHVAELERMKAVIITDGNEAKISGVPHLKGTGVRATDLRAGAALIIAGLAAEGETYVSELHHLDRGYHNFVGKLKALGADIERIHLKR